MNTLGIVTALPGEARVLARQKCAPLSSLRLADNVHLQLSGMGPVAAGRAAQRLLDEGASALVSWGCAGGLDGRLTAGNLLLPSQVCNAEGDVYSIASQWRKRLANTLDGKCEHGLLLSSNQPVSSIADKAQCHARTQAIAVDMESASIAAVAQAAGVPFLVVRAVADTADSAVPPAALRALSDSGELQLSAIIHSLAKRPGQIPALLSLGRGFRMAQASLAAVVAQAGPRLGAT